MRPFSRHRNRIPRPWRRQDPILPPATIGHNQGPPLDPATSWNAFAWRKAHKAAWKTPPIEVVRRRVCRAADLGLSYADYTAVILDRGTFLHVLFFDLGGTLAGVRRADSGAEPARRLAPLPGVVEKLSRLKDCEVFVVADLAEMAAGLITAADARAFVEELNRRCNAVITDYRIGMEPSNLPRATGKPRAKTVIDLLTAHKLSPSAAALIGDSDSDRSCAMAARLARFIWARSYFGWA